MSWDRKHAEEAERNTRALRGGKCNDLLVHRGGSVYLVMPLTNAGYDWLEETAPEGALFHGQSMAVEHRYISGVVECARDAGLEVA